ncbi:STAS domain-containing protein [Rhodoferax sp. 4810]|uniref:STAS domain-containing protein n=1 Tax=Thiospirillum jenense TaxID=1653858 RepID=A0A839H5W6_9GAMM|nr:STAS domain-containing protein [Thiospirillum jenense]MBB1076301.1 STAS domain-containing protein [Rhodoferax jenense]MBB1124894.1 STAS domain-containing protein [Thiospirillum jenense]
MTVNLTSAPDTPLTFHGEMTIYTANEQFQHLQQHLSTHPSLVLDLSGVTELDSAGLQLVLMAHTEATRRNIPFRLHNPSLIVQEVFHLLRLERALMPTTTAPKSGS